ncbi:MAG TPA: phospholipase D-like domain-containing protein [Psychrobacter sp.]|uniref:phospholipase D-like domain-containing protein n=1 Tax=Psychrobacter sp. TaxID=56811 RepID=UPI002CC29D45|nr:phospholipase D-like domain-containing protein [Psychrobacter sp.]HSP86053.1 phospholipase D-like domain-containing protein [Psychrobacter sp.]
MAKFLNSSGTTYHLEELIKNASDRLIIISPYLKLNERIKELLEDRNRLKIDIRIVYGKNDLHPEEINWLKNLTFIRTSFCKNLHAKCYLNENECIITSLNLYEFSQVNNNEMGVLIYRNEDAKLYADTYEEAQRIIRISDEVRMSLEKVTDSDSNADSKTKSNSSSQTNPVSNVTSPSETPNYSKLTTAKLAKELGFKTQELNDKLLAAGYLQEQEGELLLTDAGRAAGGTSKRGKFGEFCLWDSGMVV